MNLIKTLIILLVVFTTSTSLAQKENAQKIQGCWVFKKIKYTTIEQNLAEDGPQPNSITVCFEASGKYTTTIVNSTDAITGQYKLSEDGKTLKQQKDIQEEGTVDEDATLEFLADNTMILKLEFANLHFERKQ